MPIFIIITIVILLFGFTAFFGAPYVPSLKTELEKAFTELYSLSKKDTLIDLGAGDGIVLKIASIKNAKSIGVELNPIIALIAKIRLRKNKNARIICKNFYDFNFPKETTVIYVFGVGRDIEKIERKIISESKRLKKPLHVISNGFEFKNLKLIKQTGAFYLYRV